MSSKEEYKKIPEALNQLFTSFGETLSEIFDDPELKSKARELGSGAAASASLFASRFKDEDVRQKFQQVGEAARQFGTSVARSTEEFASRVKDGPADHPPR